MVLTEVGPVRGFIANHGPMALSGRPRQLILGYTVYQYYRQMGRELERIWHATTRSLCPQSSSPTVGGILDHPTHKRREDHQVCLGVPNQVSMAPRCPTNTVAGQRPEGSGTLHCWNFSLSQARSNIGRPYAVLPNRGSSDSPAYTK